MNEADTLLAQALAAVQQGDFRTAADRFERAGQTLAIARPGDAVSAFESAARLRLMLDDPRRAQANVARAVKLEPYSARVLKVSAEVTDKTGDLIARKAAWLAVADVGDRGQRREANIHLAAIAREANEHAVAEGHFSAALEDLPENAASGDAGSGDAANGDTASGGNNDSMRAELLLEIAICRGTQENWAGSEEALAALDALIPAEDPENFRARMTGQRGVIAYGKGDFAAALKDAEIARDGAVERNDVMTYLSASTLIAAIHEKQERLVEAYDTYIRARESLGQLLGEQAKGLVQPAVTLFEERLGPEKFKVVWDQWVAMRKAKRS